MRLSVSAVLSATLLLVAGCAAAPAATVSVTGAWVRATASADEPSAGYLTIVNNTGQPQKLTGVTSSAADTIDIHRSVLDQNTGMTEMLPVPEINVPNGGTVTLEPGGFHIMLIGLHQRLAAGGPTIPLTLTFAPAGPITVQADVRAIAP